MNYLTTLTKFMKTWFKGHGSYMVFENLIQGHGSYMVSNPHYYGEP